MRHIYIFGWFWHEDLKYVEPAFHDAYKIWSGPNLSYYTTRPEELQVQLNNASTCDLVIFSGQGMDLARHLQPVLDDPVANGYFLTIPRKVFWSFDSHHAYNEESGYAQFFNTVYVAHETYRPLVRAEHKEDLPCCFWPLSYDDLNVRLKSPPARLTDVFFKHRSYSWGDRDALLRSISTTLSNNNLSFDVVPGNDRIAYCDALHASQVVLNISLLCDLNFRNFEAWAFGRPLITNELGWHTKVAADALGSTFFFRRDLSDFEEALHRALNHSAGRSVESINAVLGGHMLMHRIVQIINTEFSTDFRVDFPHLL